MLLLKQMVEVGQDQGQVRVECFETREQRLARYSHLQECYETK